MQGQALQTWSLDIILPPIELRDGSANASDPASGHRMSDRGGWDFERLDVSGRNTHAFVSFDEWSMIVLPILSVLLSIAYFDLSSHDGIREADGNCSVW